MKVKNFDLGVRNRAVGMIQAGMSQRDVALEIGASVRAMQRCTMGPEPELARHSELYTHVSLL